MSTFAQLVSDAYFWLGTNPTNQAFPPTQIKRLVNQAQASFHEDCLQSFPDALSVARTLTADGTDPTSYVFGDQSPSLGDVALVLEVRLVDARGVLLDEAPFSERHRRSGYTYSLVGVGSGITLYAGRNITSGTALYIAYVPAVADLAEDGDRPTWLPDRFHDVLSLTAAKLAAGSGNEQTLSPLLLDRLSDREGQARFAFGQRSLTPSTRRTQGV